MTNGIFAYSFSPKFVDLNNQKVMSDSKQFYCQQLELLFAKMIIKS